MLTRPSRSEQKFPKPPSRTSRSERLINVTMVCAGHGRTRCATPEPTALLLAIRGPSDQPRSLRPTALAQADHAPSGQPHPSSRSRWLKRPRSVGSTVPLEPTTLAQADRALLGQPRPSSRPRWLRQTALLRADHPSSNHQRCFGPPAPPGRPLMGPLLLQAARSFRLLALLNPTTLLQGRPGFHTRSTLAQDDRGHTDGPSSQRGAALAWPIALLNANRAPPANRGPQADRAPSSGRLRSHQADRALQVRRAPKANRAASSQPPFFGPPS